MTVLTWEDLVSGLKTVEGEVSLTTGVFDGIHRGHRMLLDRLKAEKGTRSIVSTFTSNPFRFFSPERYLGDILTQKRKLDLFEALNIDYLLLIDFSADFSKLSGREFFSALNDRLALRHLVLGRNHRCGRRGDTGAEEARLILEPLGVTVDIIEPLVIDGHPVSSTRIREAVTEGDVEKAEKLIGRPYSLDLRGIEGTGRGTELLLKREDIEQIIPKPGRYTCLAGNERTAVTAVLEIDDRTLYVDMGTELEVTNIDFLRKRRSDE